MATFDHGYALIVGVGADLPNTVTDAQGLANILTDPERCAYPAEQVKLLTEQAATRQGILDELDLLAQGCTPESTVVIYFSGHGAKVYSQFGQNYFLIPYGYDRQHLGATAIRGDEFARKLAAIGAKRLLLLLDCCHAGGVGAAKAPAELPGEVTLSKSSLPPEALDLLAQGEGRALIASSTEDELSYAGKPYSAFTLALIEALNGAGVAKKDGSVRVADLALHAREMVPQRTKGQQHPVLHYEQADNFVVAFYAGGETQPKSLPFDLGQVEIEPEPGAFRGPVPTTLNQQKVKIDTISGGQVNIAGRDIVSRQVNTGGGDYIEGSINTQGGDFVGGNKRTYNYGARPTGGIDLLSEIQRLQAQARSLALSPGDRNDLFAKLDNLHELASSVAPDHSRLVRLLREMEGLLEDVGAEELAQEARALKERVKRQ